MRPPCITEANVSSYVTDVRTPHTLAIPTCTRLYTRERIPRCTRGNHPKYGNDLPIGRGGGRESPRKRRTKRPSWRITRLGNEIYRNHGTPPLTRRLATREERPPRGLFNVLISRVCQRWKLLPCLSPL